MATKLRLGKGLDALLPVDESEPETNPQEERIASIALESLRPNPDQPRKNFDQEKLEELADSIKVHGIIDPLIVESLGDGTYQIIGGERRFRAASLAGLTEVPALIRTFTPQERMEVALIENIQRADLNPVEEAHAYRNLMELTGLSQDEIAAKVGKSRSAVANTVRLLKLPAAMAEALEQGIISSGHGRALLSLSNSKDQETLFNAILQEDLTVRETEKRAGSVNGLSKNRARKKAEQTEEKRDPELKALEQRFIETLGTKVSIQGDFAKGAIRIEYYSMEDLERLLELMGSR